MTRLQTAYSLTHLGLTVWCLVLVSQLHTRLDCSPGWQIATQPPTSAQPPETNQQVEAITVHSRTPWPPTITPSHEQDVAKTTEPVPALQPAPRPQPPSPDLVDGRQDQFSKVNEVTKPLPLGASESSPRPRTIKEALARRAESGLVGEKMKEGGVKNLGVSALDVRGMSFGAYDAAIIQAIQQRWYSLLESRPTPRGKVVVGFRMHFDGRVSNVNISETQVGETYSTMCQQAIQDPAPYPKWPSDMRRQLQADHRDVKFTFHYN